jgi:hypothetical protein
VFVLYLSLLLFSSKSQSPTSLERHSHSSLASAPQPHLLSPQSAAVQPLPAVPPPQLAYQFGQVHNVAPPVGGPVIPPIPTVPNFGPPQPSAQNAAPYPPPAGNANPYPPSSNNANPYPPFSNNANPYPPPGAGAPQPSMPTPSVHGSRPEFTAPPPGFFPSPGLYPLAEQGSPPHSMDEPPPGFVGGGSMLPNPTVPGGGVSAPPPVPPQPSIPGTVDISAYTRPDAYAPNHAPLPYPTNPARPPLAMA